MAKKLKKNFSVIIRGNNKAHWLKILLKKIKLQSRKDFEIIYCDNNSSDETLGVLKKFNVKKILNIKNYTPGKALNMSIKKTSGKYILFISSHCIPLNNFWLDQFYEYMENNPEIVASYGRQFPLPGTSSKDKLDLSILFREEPTIFSKDSYLNNANAIYKSAFLKKNLFDENLTNIEDRIWAKNINKKNKKIGYTAKSSVFHIDGIHQHRSSSERAQKSFKIISNDFKKYWSSADFLKSDFYNYVLLINGRRCKNKKFLQTKISKLIKHRSFKNIRIKKILIISNLSKIKIKNIKVQNIKPNAAFGEDLERVYNLNKQLWTSTNYVIFLNSEFIWDLNKIKKLINFSCYNSYENVNFVSKIISNFDIIYKNGSLIKSNSLEDRQDKPWIKLDRSPEGCILIPYLLKKKRIASDEVKNYYIE